MKFEKKIKKAISFQIETVPNGKKHDLKLFKESRVRWTKKTNALTDSGYTGIQKIQSTTRLPRKRRKGKALTKEEK